MRKRKTNSIYKKLLNELSENFGSNHFRVCVQMCELTGMFSEHSVEELFPEWSLFKGICEDDWWGFFKEENGDELRVIALQLCIEMTN